MKKYWFEFEFSDGDIPPGISLGCGVTAYNYDDALQLLSQMVFDKKHLPRITKMIENVDVSSLDKGHVLPNMAPPNTRGIWFPIGYSS